MSAMRSGAGVWLLAALVMAGGCASSPVSQPAPPVEAAPGAAQPAEPSPAPVPTPGLAAPQPPVSAVAAPPGDDLAQPLIRVLLARSSEPVTLPQPQRAWRVTGGEAPRWLWGPLELGVESEAVFQVGAWRDEQVAAGAATRLAGSLGPQVRVWRETTTDGLVRVRVHWLGEPPADPAAALAALGFPDPMEVAGGSRVRVAGSGGEVVAEGELLLEPASAWPIAVGSRQVRGRLRVRLGLGGELLVIDELSLEAYLRGVVPAEMGPAVFPELEALKAQAVAARTYAVAHLGDHADEGYDLCATPACQAYAGVAAEHRLTDRAVADTAGLVATWQGAPIDAMYSSTCGGHTEDAGLLFPDRAQPYLVGVPCAWERRLEVSGEAVTDGEPRDQVGFAAAVATRLLGVAPEADGAAVLAGVARRLGTAPPAGDADTPDDLAAALLELSGLATAGERLTPATTPLEQLLYLADLYHVELAGPAAANRGRWPAAAALAVLELRGDVTRDQGEAVPRPDGMGIFPRRAERSEPLPSPLPLWEELDRAWRPLATAGVRPGTGLVRYRAGDRVLALVVERGGGDGEADRRSAWRDWIRERSWSEIAAALGVPDLSRLKITRRGQSGRVVGLEAVGEDGHIRTVSGFEIRRVLDLPDTLFAMHVRSDPDGTRIVRFLGRGWGHGIGLCQNGAYGLARAGMSFDRILEHYYTGISLVSWPGTHPR